MNSNPILTTTDNSNGMTRTVTSADASLWAAIVQNSNDAIFVRDQHGIILAWNPAAERLFGYRAAEIIGGSVNLLFPPDRQREAYEIMARVNRGETFRTQDTVRIAKDGTPLNLSITVSPVRNARGELIGASIIARDISERKTLERARQETINILSAIVEGTTDGIFVKNRDGRYLMINRAGATNVGLTIQEVEGKFDRDFLDPLTSEMIRADDLRIMAQGAPETIEHVLPSSSGTRVYHSVKAPYRDTNGNIIGIIGIARDVTDRRQSEQELMRHVALLDLSPNAISVRDLDGRVRYWSRGAEKMFGWSAQEIIGQIGHEFLHTESELPFEMIHTRLLEQGEWHGEMRKRTRAGKLIVVSSSQVLQYDEHGKPTAILQINQDITERQRSEQIQQFMIEATDELGVSLDPEVALQTFVEKVVPSLADWAAIHILNEEGMIQRAAFAHPDPQVCARINARVNQYPLDTQSRHLVSFVIRTGATEFYETVSDQELKLAARDDEHFRVLHDQLGVRSYLCLPLRARGTVFGAVTFAYADSGCQYTRADLGLMTELVRRVALAVDNARLYQASQAAQSAFELLAAASVELISSLNPEANLESFVRLLVPRFAEWCAIHLLQPDGSLQLAALAHAEPELEEFLHRRPQDYPLTLSVLSGTQVIRTRQTEWVQDYAAPDASAQDMPLPSAARTDYLARLQLRSYVIVPLIVRDRVLGAITFARARRLPRYNLREVVIAEELARRAAIALDHITLYQTEQQARHDAQQKAAHIGALQRVTSALSNALTREQVAKILLNEGLEPFDAQGGIITEYHAEDESVEILSSIGFPVDAMGRWRRFSVTENIPLAEVIRTGEPIFLESRQALQARYQRAPSEGITYNAWLFVPLEAHQRVVSGMSLSFQEPREFTKAEREFAMALARQGAQALERATLYESEQQARQVAEQAARRSDWLVRASALLAGSLDYKATLSQVAQLAVPELADWCQIHIVTPDGNAEQLVTAHSDPEKLNWAQNYIQEIERFFELDWKAPHGLPNVLRTGKAELYPEIPDELLVRVAQNETQLEILRGIGCASAMIVPLNIQNHTLGAITFANTDSRRRLTPEDLESAELLAGRAASAIENARLYEETQRLNAELEARVEQRTFELYEAYNALKQQEDALQESNKQLRALAARLETIREQERLDIARELHDELGQSLTALKMDVSGLLTRLPKRNVELRERAQDMSNQIDLTIKSVRRLSSQLRPGMLDDLGLSPSLEWYAQEFQTRTGIQMILSIPNQDLDLELSCAIALFRIFQETLTNIARHAQARHVWVALHAHDGIVALKIQDDGVGIDLSQARVKHSLGLLGMRERAEALNGTLEISGEPGSGTTVLVRIPFAVAGSADDALKE